MAIYRLLQQKAFEPDDVARMTNAYEEALRRLQLKDRTDPVTEVVAKRIIEIAQTGEKDPAQICSLAIDLLGMPRTR